ncbi:class I SAM-dependent methyltransferase [Nonomuraea sp. NN258]|uniref:class I SAM-dependent methyltransferase n=1 Tax=Nonomuraea antri TaxID=2730852 RepID=UPI001568BA40|nr:class I SAM-dependent methyltransferase [Nonomuraea antri]NRQ30909.1 class I SAM-dependent methyltransferase [Nonomuraea antri]
MNEAQRRQHDGRRWEKYWARVVDGQLSVPPWEWDHTEAMAPYLPTLLQHFPQDLPLIDMGCGTGALTSHLAAHFPRVVGLDVSTGAIAEARRRQLPGNVEFHPLDLTDVAAARHLRGRLGEANVHMRGVLHVLSPSSTSAALHALSVLTGRRGLVFDIEPRLGADAGTIEPDALPERVRELGRTDLPTQRIADLAGLYEGGGWRVLRSGREQSPTDMRMPDGTPYHYLFHFTLASPPPEGS